MFQYEIAYPGRVSNYMQVIGHFPTYLSVDSTLEPFAVLRDSNQTEAFSENTKISGQPRYRDMSNTILKHNTNLTHVLYLISFSMYFFKKIVNIWIL